MAQTRGTVGRIGRAIVLMLASTFIVSAIAAPASADHVPQHGSWGLYCKNFGNPLYPENMYSQVAILIGAEILPPNSNTLLDQLVSTRARLQRWNGSSWATVQNYGWRNVYDYYGTYVYSNPAGWDYDHEYTFVSGMGSARFRGHYRILVDFAWGYVMSPPDTSYSYAGRVLHYSHGTPAYCTF